MQSCQVRQIASVLSSGGEALAKTALGTYGAASYTAWVSAFLRWAGIVNAAIWFGASIFLVVALGAIFSKDILDLFHESSDAAHKYYSGAVAMAVFHRYFALQYVCGVIALLHLFAEKLYLGRALSRFSTGLVAALLVVAFVGGIWLQPKMEKLRKDMYSNIPAEQRARAEHSFNSWHAASECVNLLVMAGLLVHLLRVTRPEESRRYGTLFPQFRG